MSSNRRSNDRRRAEDESPLDWNLSQSSHSSKGSKSLGGGSMVSFGDSRSLVSAGSRDVGRPADLSLTASTSAGLLRTEPLSLGTKSSSLVSYEGSRDLVSVGSAVDDTSLAGQSLAYSTYSLDDQSRASTYISEASNEDEAKKEQQEKQKQPRQTDVPSVLGVNRPVEYIMDNENHDDDMSTIGGTFFNDASSIWDGSTIATTPTLRQEIGPNPCEQETIYEEDEEEEDGESREERLRQSDSAKNRSSQSSSIYSKASQQSSKHSVMRGISREAQGSSMSTVGMESVQGKARRSRNRSSSSSVAQVSEASASQFEGTYTTSMYDRTLPSDDALSIAGSIRSADFAGTGLTDEDALWYHEGEEDYDSYDIDSFANQSLPVVYPDDSASLMGPRSTPFLNANDGRPTTPPRKKRSSAWSQSGSEGANMSLRGARTVQSEVLYRGGMSGAMSVGAGSTTQRSLGARTVQSDGFILQQRRQDFRDMYREERPRAVLPREPEVMHFGGDGPMMTKGLSGRAVVHVALSSTTDGSIQDLDYTIPLVEADEKNSTDQTDASTTLGSGTELPWFAYYVKQHGWVERCYSRRCYRTNAILLLVVTLLVSVIITVTTVSVGDSPVPHEGRSTKGLLDDLTPPAGNDVSLPSLVSHHVDDWFKADSDYALQTTDVPFFWNIPLSSASVIQENWGRCVGLTQASGVGRVHASEENLRVVQIFGASYVNVDTATPEGVNQAGEKDLIGSGLADVMFSPLVYEVLTNLYDRRTKAKLIVVLRHPVDRAVAMHKYLSTATSDPSYDPSIASMTLEQFATSKYIDNNYVCRVLLNKLGGALDEADLNKAKEILRLKAVVGIHEDMLQTVEHIERYFGWLPFTSDAAQCQRASLESGTAKLAVQNVDPGSATWELIKSHNRYDLALYEYVRNILLPYQQEVVRRQQVHIPGNTPVG